MRAFLAAHRALPSLPAFGGLAALSALLLTGCMSDLPNPSRIEGLRIIGLRAQPPEVAEGESVTMEVLATDSEGRPITYRWLACLKAERGSGFFSGGSSAGTSGGGGYSLDDPGSCFELEQALAQSPGATLPVPLLPLGTDAAVRLAVPTGITSNPTVVASAYGLPAQAALAPPIIALLTSVAGVNLTVGVRAEVDGDVVEAFKRVNVSTAAEKNINPTDLRFHLAVEGSPEDDVKTFPRTGPASRRGGCFGEEEDTVPMTVYAAKWSIRPMNVPTSAEDAAAEDGAGEGGAGESGATDAYASYQVILGSTNPDSPFGIQTKEEVNFYSVFSTVGTFGSRTFKGRADGSTTWDLPSDLPEFVPLWIVVRDGRGGTSWCHSKLVRVDPPSAPRIVGERIE
jgi:hypothetical protein